MCIFSGTAIIAQKAEIIVFQSNSRPSNPNHTKKHPILYDHTKVPCLFQLPEEKKHQRQNSVLRVEGEGVRFGWLFSQLTYKPGVMRHAYKPSYLEDWGKRMWNSRIVWATQKHLMSRTSSFPKKPFKKQKNQISWTSQLLLSTTSEHKFQEWRIF